MRRLLLACVLLGCSAAEDGGTPAAEDSGPVVETSVATDIGGEATAPEAASALDGAVDDVAAKSGVFVAVGYGGRRVVSNDGVTWSHDVQDVASGGDDEWLLRDVGYGGGAFVAVGFRIEVAPDAIAWTEAGKMGQWLGGIAYGKGKWVAAGGYGRRANSSDGKTWKDADDGGLHGAYRGLTFGGDRWVGVGDGGRRSVSSDGIAWEEGTGDGASSLSEVTFGGGTFVAIGGTTVLRSSDGKTWKAATAPVELEGIVWDGTRFVAVGGGKALTSKDGASFDEIGSGPSGTLAYGNGAYVAIAWGGTVWRSTDGTTWKSTKLAGDNSFARLRFFAP